MAMNFGEFVTINRWNITSEKALKRAMKLYSEYEEGLHDELDFRCWCVQKAVEYYDGFDQYSEVVASWNELGENETVLTIHRHDGWTWEEYDDKAYDYEERMPEDYADEPGYTYHINPLTKEVWSPYESDEGVRVVWSNIAENELKNMNLPGYNNGWTEEAAENEYKEANRKNLLAWAHKAWAEEFYDLISYSVKGCEKYDRKPLMLEYAREEFDHIKKKEKEELADWYDLMTERYTDFDVETFLEVGNTPEDIAAVVKYMPHTVKNMKFTWGIKKWIDLSVCSDNVCFFVAYEYNYYFYDATKAKWIHKTPSLEVEEFFCTEFKKALVRALN